MKGIIFVMKVLGYFHSKLTQIKGSGNPNSGAFYIEPEFNKTKGGLHFMPFWGEQDMINWKMVKW